MANHEKNVFEGEIPGAGLLLGGGFDQKGYPVTGAQVRRHHAHQRQRRGNETDIPVTLGNIAGDRGCRDHQKPGGHLY